MEKDSQNPRYSTHNRFPTEPSIYIKIKTRKHITLEEITYYNIKIYYNHIKSADEDIKTKGASPVKRNNGATIVKQYNKITNNTMKNGNFEQIVHLGNVMYEWMGHIHINVQLYIEAPTGNVYFLHMLRPVAAPRGRNY